MSTRTEAGPGALPKAPTGISGLDEVTRGGLPRGRPTLVCGPAGCCKTLLAMEFLVRGITEFGEPGVFIAFEESAEDLAANVASLGFDLRQFEADGLLVLDHVNVVAGEMEEAGEWDLDGLFLRLGAAIDAVGAKRVVIDTIETLFGAFSNTAVLRSELRRMIVWLKEGGVTAVITGERGDGTFTRYGIEEYVSDCVIVLDHRVTEQTSTRRLRILKYRAKSLGGGRAEMFDAALGRQAKQRASAQKTLDSALDERRIVIHFQPLVDLSSGRIAGFEALARIAEPDGSILPPADFIPVAEDSELVVPLGGQVLALACEEARGWQPPGIADRRLTVAVNLSPRQFGPGDLTEVVQRTLASAPAWLRAACTWSSPRRRSWTSTPTSCASSSGSGISAWRWASTTSAPATPRSRTSAGSR